MTTIGENPTFQATQINESLPTNDFVVDQVYLNRYSKRSGVEEYSIAHIPAGARFEVKYFIPQKGIDMTLRPKISDQDKHGLYTWESVGELDKGTLYRLNLLTQRSDAQGFPGELTDEQIEQISKMGLLSQVARGKYYIDLSFSINCANKFFYEAWAQPLQGVSGTKAPAFHLGRMDGSRSIPQKQITYRYSGNHMYLYVVKTS